MPSMIKRLSVVASATLVVGLGLLARAEQQEPAHTPLLDPATAQMTLPFSTYLGGQDSDTGSAIAIDPQGYIYVAGQTTSDDFPTRGGVMAYQGGSEIGTDVFIAKLSPGGDSLLYATYLGGSGDDVATALLVDDQGRILVAGSTTSDDFPTILPVQAYQGSPALQSDAFIARFRADGTALDFATPLGGMGEEVITALALGPEGSLYAAGTTTSDDFPVTPTAFQQNHAGGGLIQADAFVLKLIPRGDGYQQSYTTYLGGRIDEVLTGLTVDAAGQAYVTGFTNSPDFPTRNALQNTFAGPMREGEGDIFLTRLTPDGQAIGLSTYLGREDDDQSTGLALLPDGTLYLTGWTRSVDFPTTPGAIQQTLRGNQDAFIARLIPSANGVTLAYATLLGGYGDDIAYGMAIDPAGGMWISGTTDAAAFPMVLAPQPVPGGGRTEVFAAYLTAGGDSLTLATYLGGSGDEGFVRGVRGTDGSFCITGTTFSFDFPTRNAVQAEPPGDEASGNAFVSCLSEAPMPVATEDVSDVPDAFALHANYPNPFNPTTTIPFTVAQPTHVVLDVYDVAGRRVATLVDGTYPPGYYETPFDARGLASGVYLYRVTMGDFQATRSLVLLR